MYRREPDITKVRFNEAQIATTAAALLQHMTGDSCAVIWDDHNKFTIARQTREGKVVNG